MIEREFKDLVSSLEIENIIKKENNFLINNIIDSIKNNISKNIKLDYIKVLFEPIKDEKEYTLYLSLTLKNKTLPYQLIQFITMNEIENCLLLNIKNNLLFKENTEFNNLIKRDYTNNLISFNLETLKVNFYLYYNKSSISNQTMIKETIDCYDFQMYTEIDYFTYLKKEYIRFDNSIKILKSFCLDNKLISNRYLFYILAYSLNNYNNK